MTRPFSAANLAALESPNIAPIYFLELDIDTTSSPQVFVRLHTGLGQFTTGTSDNPTARQFTGAGTLLSFDTIKETNQLKPLPLVCTLSGVDSTVSGLVLNQTNVYRRPCRMYIGGLSNGLLVDDPDLLFSGFIEKLEMQVAGERGDTIQLTAENELILFKRSKDVRYTDRQLQSEYSGDLGLEFLESTSQSTVVWRGRANRLGSEVGGGGLSGTIRNAVIRARQQ